jgi:hypothetical protein
VKSSFVGGWFCVDWLPGAEQTGYGLFASCTAVPTDASYPPTWALGITVQFNMNQIIVGSVERMSRAECHKIWIRFELEVDIMLGAPRRRNVAFIYQVQALILDLPSANYVMNQSIIGLQKTKKNSFNQHSIMRMRWDVKYIFMIAGE